MLLYIKLERLVLLSFLTSIYLVFWVNTVKENLRRRHRPQIENHRSQCLVVPCVQTTGDFTTAACLPINDLLFSCPQRVDVLP